MDDDKELYSLHELSCNQLHDDFMNSSVVSPEICDSGNSLLDESKKSSIEIGPPCPRRMTDAKAPFR